MAYEKIPVRIGWENCGVPEELRKKYTEPDEEGYLDYFDFCKIKVEDFVNWYYETKPFEKAGWVHRYEKWLYDTKGIIPYEDDVYHYWSGDFHAEDICWLEYIDTWEPSCSIMEYFLEHNIPGDSFFIFCFDC